MVEVISNLLGLDLSLYNQNIVLLVAVVFLSLVVRFLYDLLIMLFGYIGGRRK